MSDTPRTDGECEHIQNAHNDWVCNAHVLPRFVVPADFARTLERELSEAREAMLRTENERLSNKKQLTAYKAMCDRLNLIRKELHDWSNKNVPLSKFEGGPPVVMLKSLSVGDDCNQLKKQYENND